MSKSEETVINCNWGTVVLQRLGTLFFLEAWEPPGYSHRTVEMTRHQAQELRDALTALLAEVEE